jgi:glycosyltransferase involved in cell wall biosynthesis
MERRQVDLLLKVLRILHQEGILDHLLLIGSWVFYFYKFYFHKRKPIVASLRTRDVDFLVPSPSSINKKINLPDLLKKLGFVVDFRGEQGYMRLVSPYFLLSFWFRREVDLQISRILYL